MYDIHISSHCVYSEMSGLVKNDLLCFQSSEAVEHQFWWLLMLLRVGWVSTLLLMMYASNMIIICCKTVVHCETAIGIGLRDFTCSAF